MPNEYFSDTENRPTAKIEESIFHRLFSLLQLVLKERSRRGLP
jgi:hypothetical protein